MLSEKMIKLSHDVWRTNSDALFNLLTALQEDDLKIKDQLLREAAALLADKIPSEIDKMILERRSFIEGTKKSK